MSAAARVPVRLSVRDFLQWESGDGLHYELVDGEPLAMAPAGTIHAFLQNELGRLIGNYLREHRPACEILANPGVVPRLLSAYNVRVPDLGVTCRPLVPGHATLSDPVLLIEILSPSNQASTWSDVRAYTSIPSVQEIVVLDSTRVAADVLRRLPAGEWPDQPDELRSGDLLLSSIGFSVNLATLYGPTGVGG